MKMKNWGGGMGREREKLKMIRKASKKNHFIVNTYKIMS